jgi:hypothetical protein
MRDAPIAQRIEQTRPKGTMRVQFLLGVLTPSKPAPVFVQR